MHDAGSDKMSQIISLEVQSIGKSIVVFRSRGSTYYRIVLVVNLLVHTSVQFCDNHWRKDISVFTLRFYHTTDEPIHNLIEFCIMSDGIDSSYRLKPFIHVTIMERRTVMLSDLLTRGHEEVVETLSLLALPSFPHTLHRCATENIEALTPEATCPFHGTDGCRLQH